MNKWILSGDWRHFWPPDSRGRFLRRLMRRGSVLSEQWAFYNDGTFSIEEEKNRYAVYDDPFGQPWAPRGLAL